MIRSFDSLALRQLGTRRLRALLTCFGIVLGVGMMFGVLLLVSTVRHTFDDLIDSAWGETDLIVASQAGTLPARAVEQVREDPGVFEVAPWVGAIFARLDDRGHVIEGNAGKMMVAGFDPTGPDPVDFHFIAGRRVHSGLEINVDRNWAHDRGYVLGERMPVATPSGRVRLRIVGLFRLSGNASFGDRGMAGMPLNAVRRLAEQPTGYMMASVIARDRGDVDQLQARLKRTLGSEVEVQTPTQVGEDFRAQIDAFNVILYFFSGVALFVGGFLILNSFNMTVLQRMREIGMLRTLGATRGMVVRTVMTEALLLGVIGALLGLGLGLGLAVGLVELLKGLDVPIGRLYVPASAAVVAVVVGLVVTALGSLYPARRAGMIPPIRAVLGAPDVGRAASPWRLAIGLALLLPGLLLGGSFWFGGQNTGSTWSALAGIGGTMAMFAGIAVTAPFVVMPIVRALAIPLRRIAPSGGRLAADAATSNPGRTAATAAALTIGLAVFVVNAGLSQSFLGSIDDQIDQGFARDFTVQPLGTPLELGGEQAIPPRLHQQIAALPETGVVTPIRSLLLDLPGIESGMTQGLAIGIDPAAYGRVDKTPIEGATRTEALRGVADGGVLVGAMYARAANLQVGDTVLLEGGAGNRRAPVVGVLDAIGDYQGNMMQISLPTMREVYGVTSDAALAVQARSAADRNRLEQRVAALVDRNYPNLELLSAADVKDAIDDAMAQQFGLFNAIVAVAVIVSLLGVINTLAMSALERTREIGVLRALGSTRWQIRLSLLHESMLTTLAGAIAGIAFGSVIAWFWVGGLESIVPGITFRFPLGTALIVAVLAVIMGVLAAVLPARRAARLDPIQAISYE